MIDCTFLIVSVFILKFLELNDLLPLQAATEEDGELEGLAGVFALFTAALLAEAFFKARPRTRESQPLGA